jgi:hemolysin D
MTEALGTAAARSFARRSWGRGAVAVLVTGERTWLAAQWQVQRAAHALRRADRAWLPLPGRRSRRRAATAAAGFADRPWPGRGGGRDGEPPPDLEDILSERPPWLLRGPHYVIAALFVLVLLLASVLKVDVIVAARGKLAPDGPPVVLQPLERGVIREIRVNIGDKVRKGAILATLDATFTAADRAALIAQQSVLAAQIRRLNAELDGTKLATEADAGADALLQQKLYDQRQAQYAARLDGFDADIARDRTALRAAQDARALLSRQLDIARQIEAMRAQLFKGEIGSKLNYLEAQAERVRAQHEYQDQLSKTAELEQTLRSAKADRDTFIDGWHRELLEDLAKARTAYSTASESLAKAVRLNNLVVLRAPADGVVLDVPKRSVGSVLNAAEPLITLVPSNTPLIAEVMIASADVGYAAAGDKVIVKVDAFPYQRNGYLEGRLRSIGEDSVSSATGEQGAAAVAGGGGFYHPSEVSLSATMLHDLPAGTHLIPGMTATAEINVGSRSVLSYFLYPLSRGLSESFREP